MVYLTSVTVLCQGFRVQGSGTTAIYETHSKQSYSLSLNSEPYVWGLFLNPAPSQIDSQAIISNFDVVGLKKLF